MATVTFRPFAAHVAPVGLVVEVVVGVGEVDVVVVAPPMVDEVVVGAGPVVEGVGVGAGPVVDVVVVGGVGVSRAAITPATQLSTAPSSAEVFPVGGWQSLPDLFSIFAMQPFSGVSPPSNFALTLSTQLSVFGSVGFPGVCAF